MVNYTESRIYKIVNSITDDIYIGSTTQPLSRRMVAHRTSATANYPSRFYTFMRLHGIPNFSIILIEAFSCNSREEILAKEDHYIRTLKPTLNTKIAVCNDDDKKKYIETRKQKDKSNPEHVKQLQKESYEKHIDSRKEKMKQYGIDNKAEREVYRKQFYEDNKERIIQQHKTYYEENKERILLRNKLYLQKVKALKAKKVENIE